MFEILVTLLVAWVIWKICDWLGGKDGPSGNPFD